MANRKQRLLIVNNNFDTGGVQRALINLVGQIHQDYDITMFVFSHTGEYGNQVPPGVKVIEASPFLSLLGISQDNAKKKGVVLYFARAILALYAKIFHNYFPIRLLIATQKKLSGFDIAVSFLHGSTGKLLYGGCNEFVLHRVKAGQKITFLHCDFSQYGGNTRLNRRIYAHFDKIAAVSEGCKQSFIQAIPQLAEKTYCVTNVHNYAEYAAKASINPVDYPGVGIHLLTVARLGAEKGVLRAMEVIKRLVDEGHILTWHIVGDGEQRRIIEDKIIKYSLSENICLYGNQENPYRYMKNADVFLLPSYHEAAPMVFNEAKSLGLPIISTHTTSAKEMIEENKEGFVCENSENGLYQTLKRVLEQPDILLECKKYLNRQQYSNEKALLQFNRLMNEKG